jgi:hypothetical protein
MKIDASFVDVEQTITAQLTETEQQFSVEFKDVVIIERADIPSRYGLVTYDQNRTITVS